MNTKTTVKDSELHDVDQLLHALQRVAPPATALLSGRRAIAALTRPQADDEIMTLEEVGEMLRLSPMELESVLPNLPAFELAGRIRVRRSSLQEWINKREKAYVQASIQNAVEQSLNAQLREGVA